MSRIAQKLLANGDAPLAFFRANVQWVAPVSDESSANLALGLLQGCPSSAPRSKRMPCQGGDSVPKLWRAAGGLAFT
jgi:hypothetical protein